ncbi:DapH/DapD/GlmU-related protein [Blautia caecimuris]|uniref:DapH/DapD/GlmU-related protein n=1 Tax=Blautia caecimuris TaxID=1796615 RepID=UPI002FE6F48E
MLCGKWSWLIGKNVWPGANVTVLPGVTIGEGSVITAGVPAKVMREVKRTKEAGHNIN